MTPGSSNLVPVGNVSQIYPGKGGMSYIGISATQGFAPHHQLTCRPPDSAPDADITFVVSTAEIERQRTNVVLPGNSCTDRPSQKLDALPKPGWGVFARAIDVRNASSREQTLTPRPVPPRELRNPAHHVYK